MNLSPAEIELLRSETKRPAALGIILSFTIIAFIFVSLRLTTRFMVIKNQGFEDYFIAVAMLASIAMAGCMVKQTMYGTGLHVMFVSLDQVINGLRYLYGSIITYNIANTFTKLSILLQYKRLFTVKQMRIAINVTLGIVTVYGLWAVFASIFTCIPIRGYWDLTMQPAAKCLPRFPYWYTNGALNIFTDLLIATLPLPVIRSLQMANRHRIALMVIFGMGWFACIVSILRLHSLTVVEKHMDDSTWYSMEAAYWSCIEVNIAIICASLPVLKPMVVRFIPRFGSSKEYGNLGRGTGAGGNTTGGMRSGLGRGRSGSGGALQSFKMGSATKSATTDTDELTDMSKSGRRRGSSIDLERGPSEAGSHDDSGAVCMAGATGGAGADQPGEKNQIKVTMDIVQGFEAAGMGKKGEAKRYL